jgi:hypothetical protein
MKKLLLLVLLAGLAGCGVSVTDLSKDSKYNALINKEYRTSVDLAVFTLQDNKKEYVVEAFNKQGLPENSEKIKNVKFPMKYEGSIIYGYLPQGSIIKIIKVERHKTFEYNQINTTAEVVSEGKFKSWKINASLLMEGIDVQEINTKYIQEVK